MSMPDPVTLPCGCRITPDIEGGINVLTIIPCRQDCPNLQDALAMAIEMDKQIEWSDR